jgi:hypothetical protein
VTSGTVYVSCGVIPHHDKECSYCNVTSNEGYVVLFIRNCAMIASFFVRSG